MSHTATSTAVKRRYNEKHYKKFQADIKTELHRRIADYTQRENISKSAFLERALDALSA